MPSLSFLKRSRMYKPGTQTPFKLSRSKIELFIDCPRCFYLDRRMGVSRPSGPPFTLNSAVDTLLKKEFDIHRVGKSQHPLMKAYGIDAVPFSHPLIDTWRENFKGIQYHHQRSNLLITGAVDDVWVDPSQELIIVDYKSTAKNGEISLDADWQNSYKRQMEIYQWLFRQNKFNVSDTGYFVYCNGSTDAHAFDAKLEFKIKIIPYQGSTDWIENTLMSIKECLDNDDLPTPSDDCEYCSYRYVASEIEFGQRATLPLN